MPKKTRKQKIAAQQRRLNQLQQPAIGKNIHQPAIIKTGHKTTGSDQQTILIRKDIVKTIIITLLLIFLELIIFRI